MQINHGLTAQLNLQAAGAVAKHYHLGSRLATIEVGGKFRNGHKFANTYTDDFFPSGTGTPLTLADVPNSFSNSDYYQGAYKLGPNPDFFTIYNAFKADLAANPGTDYRHFQPIRFDRKGQCRLSDEYDRFQQGTIGG